MRPVALASALSESRFRQLLAACAGRRVLVVGDLVLDEYVWGGVHRISPEAPVMVVEEQRRTYAAGGAANVAANIAAMGGEAALLGVVGQDFFAERLREVLAAAGVRDTALLPVEDRPTTVKTRILANNQQVVRVDREGRDPIDLVAETRLLAEAEARLQEADALLLSDYHKGVLTSGLIQRLTGWARERGTPVLANPKPANLLYYRGLDLVSLNQSEAEVGTGARIQSGDDLAAVGRQLLDQTAGQAVLITLGGRGLAVFSRSGVAQHLAAFPQEVYDVSGAGDSVIAAATLARAAGADWVEAAALANLAGNAKVRKRGVVPVSRRDLEWLWAHARVNGVGESGPRLAAEVGDEEWNGSAGISAK